MERFLLYTLLQSSAAILQAGSTATTCLVLGSRLYIANVGDSRTILCRNGRLKLASQDHKPSRADEQERVHKAGGFVAHRRVSGDVCLVVLGLAASRTPVDVTWHLHVVDGDIKCLKSYVKTLLGPSTRSELKGDLLKISCNMHRNTYLSRIFVPRLSSISKSELFCLNPRVTTWNAEGRRGHSSVQLVDVSHDHLAEEM